MNYDVFKTEEFLDGGVVVALDCTLQNYEEMVFLQKIMKKLGNAPIETLLDSADIIYEETKEDIRQCFEKFIEPYQGFDPLVLYIYCSNHTLRFSASNYMCDPDEIFPIFDELIDCTKSFSPRDGVCVNHCENRLLSELNRETMKSFCESNALLILPFEQAVLDEASQILYQVSLTPLDDIQDLYLIESSMYSDPRWFVRIQNNRIRCAILDLTDFEMYTDLFDTIYFLEEPCTLIN